MTETANTDPNEIKVMLPLPEDEEYAVVKFMSENLPGVATINRTLVDFEPKVVFPWHLEIRIDCQQLGDNGMPNPEEQEILYEIENDIVSALKRSEPVNGLLLARVTLEGWRNLHFRIYDPEIIDEYLQKAINDKQYKRDLEYKMVHDKKWSRAKWYLESCTEKK